ncbi:MAG: GNAT family N-acetyltransferase [Acidobacteria bacterium]|nr:GNAT family N-acetyltransferase [Acidobacteriota bacterium]
MTLYPEIESLTICPAESGGEIAEVRELFAEYERSLGFSLCFQSFDRELSTLPGEYGAPAGRLLLAKYSGRSAGCVAFRRIEPEISEMKRLYVRPQFRGQGLGLCLIRRVITEARQIGYRLMRLDTVEPAMRQAVRLYRHIGFHQIPAYCPNPIAGAMYMELDLETAGSDR